MLKSYESSISILMCFKFAIKRGTKQGDPLSPTIFNAVLETVMRRLKQKWARSRWGVDISLWGAKRLQNLRFADDILLFGQTLPQVQKMLEDLTKKR